MSELTHRITSFMGGSKIPPIIGADPAVNKALVEIEIIFQLLLALSLQVDALTP